MTTPRETPPPTATRTATSSPGGPGDGARPLDALSARLRALGVRRARDNRVVAGVARGVAQRYDIDPILVRVGFVLLTMFFGFGVTLYLLAWLLLPAQDDSIMLVRALREKHGGAIVLCIATAISLASPPSSGENGWIHTVASMLTLGAVVWFVARQVGRGATPAPMTGHPTSSPAPPVTARPAPVGAAPAYGSPTRGGDYLAFDPASGQWVQDAAAAPEATPPAGPIAPPSRGVVAAPPARRLRRRPVGPLLTLVIVGSVVLAGSAGYLLAGTVRPQASAMSVAAACALAVVSLTLVVIGLAGRRALLPAVIAVVLIPIAIASPGRIPLDGLGDRAWTPSSAAQLRGSYSHGLGDARLDLRGLTASELAGRTMQVTVGAGDLAVELPAGVSAQVRAAVGAGSIHWPDSVGASASTDLGGDQVVTLGSGTPTLTVVAHVGLGDLSISQPRSTS